MTRVQNGLRILHGLSASNSPLVHWALGRPIAGGGIQDFIMSPMRHTTMGSHVMTLKVEPFSVSGQAVDHIRSYCSDGCVSRAE